MAKSKNHTNKNQIRKNHRNGIKKVAANRYATQRGMDPKFIRNAKMAHKHDPNSHGSEIKASYSRHASEAVKAK
ncbi:hypothetical protein FOA52_002335 [Chlamydomonas sp. UWO 241]|nr:hypothetical protein FOA52_002335 [Chlamydomonas sp. UWO 241]